MNESLKRNEILNGKRVAILATDGFEQVELLEPRKALDDAGAETVLVSLDAGQVKGWDSNDWGQSVNVDKTLDEVQASEFDGLLLPGGVMNPDKLRTIPKAVEFVRDFMVSGKPVGAICHGPWLLVEAGVVRGRHLTSWPSLKTDVRNAGGEWEDSQVVTDMGLVTSRKPADIPAFNEKLIEEISEWKHSDAPQRVKASII
jgi:protease I